ncbi:MAG: hypothetical protein O9972_09145 [Burkholderiales bacterium]|nr:hypothetical protein [Burkholderiales bacterium]
MTGKFHTTWGEFGGFKTADALRYVASAMLAFGAACSVGDQVHPSGELEEAKSTDSCHRPVGTRWNFFISEKLKLPASTSPSLDQRPGCRGRNRRWRGSPCGLGTRDEPMLVYGARGLIHGQ